MKLFWEWLKAAYYFLRAQIATDVVVHSTDDPLLSLITVQNFSVGPNANGGMIYKNSPVDNQMIADLIHTYAHDIDIPISLFAAWLHAESYFSRLARNPNKSIGPHDADTAESFLHTDFGIAQLDGRTLSSGDDPFWADLHGLAFTEIIAKTYDLSWAIPRFAKFIAKLKVDTQAEIDADPSMLPRVPNGDIRILICEAYNAGLHGAALIDKVHGTSGDWSYATGIILTADHWSKVLGET